MKEKYVAYLDILGFKDLVANNSPERVYELYDKVFTEVFTHALVGGQLQLISEGGETSFAYDPKSIDVNSLIVSDSIILWTNDTSVDSFIRILVTVKFVLNYMYKTGIPLRGAIVKGHLDKITKTLESKRDNSVTTLIGSGLVKAYSLEGEQEWSGCMVDKECIDFYEQIVYEGVAKHDAPHIEFLVGQSLLLKYPVPKKNNLTEDEYVIDWITMGHTTIPGTNVEGRFSEYEKGIVSDKVKKMIQNTVQFIEAINRSKDPNF